MKGNKINGSIFGEKFPTTKYVIGKTNPRAVKLRFFRKFIPKNPIRKKGKSIYGNFSNSIIPTLSLG
jgi:hypothetical protein